MAKRQPKKVVQDDLLDSYSCSTRASLWGFNYTDVGGPGVSGRPGLTHQDYEQWRPDEKTQFRNPKEAIMAAEMAYRRHGIVKNVIDIMSDFACRGIRLVHPSKRTQKFFQNWWKKVSGEERSERFLNSLYKLGNVCVRVQTATISEDDKADLYKATGSADIQIVKNKIKLNEIPWKYTFYHPATIDLVGGPLANFSKTPEYTVILPNDVKRAINNPTNTAIDVIDELPDELLAAARTNTPIKMPQDKFKVYHYKKDDWEVWALPMISAILLDISLYEKLKLADRAALDGAISNVRLWKLGSLEYNIAPSPAEASKLANLLQSNTQAGTLDLVWGPALELQESSTNVHQFLGQAKYEPTLMAIYGGLGIPPTLTGTFGAAGTTNNLISLKTLVERLEYGRKILLQFWNEQIEMVQKAMGFRLPARIEFDFNSLGDEVAEKNLLIQLSDRNLISDELLQLKLGHDPEMEQIRMQSEQEERQEGTRSPKSGSFYNPQIKEAMEKMALQLGLLSNNEAGLENVPDRRISMPQEIAKLNNKVQKDAQPKGQLGEGRPVNKKDSVKRKTKTFTPVSRAKMQLWADDAQSSIASILNPVFLQTYGKKNLRGLSSEQFEESEKIKFGVLCSLEPMGKIDMQSVFSALDKQIPQVAALTFDVWSNELKQTVGRELTLEERKMMQSHIYTLIQEEQENV